MAPISRDVEMPSKVRTSTVPHLGDGRMSQRSSPSWSMTPVCSMSAAIDSYSAHSPNCGGSPAVGSCWNIRARFEAYPVVSPAQKGLDALNAWKCGR